MPKTIESLGLTPAFAIKAQSILDDLKGQGITFVPTDGLRSIFDQAKLYRQSRTRIQVEEAVRNLKLRGAPYLAGVLWDVGPQPMGPWRTNALPGSSWHQHGEAVDCVYINAQGKADYAEAVGPEHHPAWQAYVHTIERHGLTAGGSWTTADFPHMQLRSASSPVASLGWPEIDRIMKERYGK